MNNTKPSQPRWARPGRALFLYSLVGVNICMYSLGYSQENLPALIKKAEPSIVVVVTFDKQGSIKGQGTGFFVTKGGDVITNYHVLLGAHRALIRTNEGKFFEIKKVQDEDRVGDLVRISVDISSEGVRPLAVTIEPPDVGERVIVIGTPLGLEKTVSDGIVSAVREIPDFGKIVQLTAPISPGSSGSPVLNMRGEVIGVATFFIVSGQNLNFAIPGERVAKLKALNGKTFSEWAAAGRDEDRTTAEELYDRGLRHLWADDYENAIAFFGEAVKRDPEMAEAYFQIGYCKGKLRRYAEAIQPYKEVIRIKPDDADAYNNLCVSYNMIGRFEEAVWSCQQAVRIQPVLAEAYNNLAWAYYKLSRFQEGIEFSKRAIGLKSDYGLAYYNLGNNYSGLKLYGEALEAYKQGIRFNPDHAETHLNLGAAYNQIGRFEDALDSYKVAIRLKPDFPEAHLNLGMTLLNLGNKGAALEEYKILKDLNKDMAGKLFNLIYE